MNCSMPGLPVHHQLLEFTQTHVHQVSGAIQPSHPLSSPSPPALNISQHQGFFPVSQIFSSGDQNIGASASASVLPMSEYSGLISFRTDWFDLLAVKGTLKSLLQAPLFKGISSSVLCILYCPGLTTICDHREASTIRTFVGRVMSLLFNTLSRFVVAFLPRSNHLLISQLQSPSTVILEPKKRKSVTASTFPPSICHAVNSGSW